jgi:hypothetical protein
MGLSQRPFGESVASTAALCARGVKLRQQMSVWQEAAEWLFWISPTSQPNNYFSICFKNEWTQRTFAEIVMQV